MEDSDLNMNIHPLEVYKAWISKTEMETGEPSKLPYDVTPEQVMVYAVCLSVYLTVCL